MSATNRGAKRVQYDEYQTPPEPIQALLKNFSFRSHGLLEPCAGRGEILKQINKDFPNSILPGGQMIAVEIQEKERPSLERVADQVFIEDFLTWEPDACQPEDGLYIDTIISNPPYGMAEKIIEHCFEIASPHADIVMLLRLGFLSSRSRRDFWKRHPLTQLLVLAERPSFGTYVRCQCGWESFYHWFQETPKSCPECSERVKTTSNDATDYAWFIWSTRLPPAIKII